jgi:hypothetical protein
MSAPASPPAVTASRLTALLHPSTLILIAANVVTIVGVLAWGAAN